MLVLSRKANERLFLGQGAELIEICIVRIGPDSVRIGINAPANLKIVRSELVLKLAESEEVAQ